MENKLELRVGDVVRLRPMTVKEFFDDGDILFAEGNWSRAELIESIISRAETDAEKIARLEGELVKAYRQIKWNGGECPVSPDMKVVVWFRDDNIKPQLSTAGSFCWGHQDRPNDITWYMVLPS